jgi:Xaa-Pro aminopeptidase
LTSLLVNCRVALLPAGAEHSCYTADISRTFPACGTFTPQQRDIYDVVLHMQQHALDALKVGAGFGVFVVLLKILPGFGRTLSSCQ